MRRVSSNMGKGFICTLVLAAASFSTLSLVGASETEARPFRPCICLDVWQPVTCSNGVTYSNQCYANCAGATGCVPGYPTY